MKRDREEEEEIIDNRKPKIEDDDDDDNDENDQPLKSRKVQNQESSNESDDSDDIDIATLTTKKKGNLSRKDCPYLDTVDRSVLDFDFEKVCSISFVNHNVYACLVCGKNFQGKSQGSHAHYHCLQNNHHVFANLSTQKIYCLPDDYEVLDPTLNDIKYLINPTFTKEQIEKLDNNIKLSRSLDGTMYLPGMVGLNNIKKNSFINVTIQFLARIPSIRDYFLNLDNFKNCKSILLNSFGELLRRIWNSKNFKPQVSPHEAIQSIMKQSGKRFMIGQESDPVEFLQWLLNTLNNDLIAKDSSKKKESIITKTFQGTVQVTTKTLVTLSSNDEMDEDKKMEPKYRTITQTIPFTTLALDLPTQSVFKDEKEKSIIPQIPLYNLLAKYNGVTERIAPNGEIKLFKLISLPKFLIFNVKRFSHNSFFKEKDPTIVNFPLKNLDLKDFINDNNKKTKYNLIAMIKHEGDSNQGNYIGYLNHLVQDKWYEMQDLSVKETMAPLVAVSEAYILVYQQD